MSEAMSFVAADGTRLHSPVGVLEVDHDADLLRCHFCGAWKQALNGHARLAHGLSADHYRQLVGLMPSTALTSPALSERRRTALKRRMDTDPRIRAGMDKGVALARSGELQARGRVVMAKRGGISAERLRLVSEQGKRASALHTNRYRQRREDAARALGYASLDDYLRRRYAQDGALLTDLQIEIGASYSALRRDLAAAEIDVPRGRRPARRRTA